MTKPKLFPSLWSVTSTFLNMTPDPCTAATHHNINTSTTHWTSPPALLIRPLLAALTDGRQLELHLQHDPLPDVLQQADDLIVPELGQVDAVNRADVVAHVQLVTPEKRSQLLLHSDSFHHSSEASLAWFETCSKLRKTKCDHATKR